MSNKSKNPWVLGHWLILWLGLTAFLAREFWLIDNQKTGSLLRLLLKTLRGHSYQVKTGASYLIGYSLGWIGFLFILGTNIYILRKRWPSLQGLGSVKNWLEFHIFCGLLGPTLIVFHSNFKVNGLVAISFWSMMISVASGIVGRYIYLQIATKGGLLENQVQYFDRQVQAIVTYINNNKVIISKAQLNLWREEVLVLAMGLKRDQNIAQRSIAAILFGSLLGDFRLFTFKPRIANSQAGVLSKSLKAWALSARRAQNLNAFRQMMGYWHSFHKPFAIFMYLVAIIHIIVVHIFKVQKL